MKRALTRILTRILTVVALATAIPAAGGSASAAPAAKTAAQPLTPVKVGHLLVPGQGKLFIAQELGYFKDAGLAVELVEFQNSADASAALRAGKLDFASAGATAPLFHISKGADDIVIVGGIHNEDAALITTPEKAKEIRSATDLKGRKVAVVRLSTGDAALRGFLVEHGIQPGKDVQFFELKSPPAVIEAIRAGEVDAGTVWEPHIVRAREAGLVVVATSHDLMPNHPCCRLITRREVIGPHPEVVEAFLTAVLRAELFGRTHRREAVDILTKYIKVDRHVVDASYVNDQPTDPDRANTVRFWNVLAAVGFVDSKKDINEHVVTTAYERALDKLAATQPGEPYWRKLQADFAAQKTAAPRKTP